MGKRDSARGVWLTSRDRQVLGFLAEHRMVLESHVAALVDRPVEPVRDRLRQLEAAEYLATWRVFETSGCCCIRRRGLEAIESRLPPPRPKLGAYRHDVGVASLWLAARGGAFGRVAEVLGERRIRSHDGQATNEPYAVRLGGYSSKGYERRHYPDLLLIDPSGRRLALELELSPKEAARREMILAAYGADRRVDGVIYVVEDHAQGRAIGRGVQGAVARMGLLDRVHVRRMTPIQPDAGGQPGRAPGRGPVRRMEAER